MFAAQVWDEYGLGEILYFYAVYLRAVVEPYSKCQKANIKKFSNKNISVSANDK